MRWIVVLIGFVIVYMLMTRIVFPKLGLPSWGGPKPDPVFRPKNKREKKGPGRG